MFCEGGSIVVFVSPKIFIFKISSLEVDTTNVSLHRAMPENISHKFKEKKVYENKKNRNFSAWVGLTKEL